MMKRWIALFLLIMMLPYAFGAGASENEEGAGAPAAQATPVETEQAAPLEAEPPAPEATAAPAEETTPEPTEKPTSEPAEEPTEALTQEPAEKMPEQPAEQTPDKAPTEQPAEQAPDEAPTGQPQATAAATPSATPRPNSRIRLEGYRVLDAEGRRIKEVLPASVSGNAYDYVFTFIDDGVLTEQAGNVSAAKAQDEEFVPVIDTQLDRRYDGRPSVRVLSGAGESLRFEVGFFHWQFLGKQSKEFAFTLRYEKISAAPALSHEVIRECVLERDVAPAASPEVTPGEKPAGTEAPTENAVEQTPNPDEHHDEGAAEEQRTDAPAATDEHTPPPAEATESGAENTEKPAESAGTPESVPAASDAPEGETPATPASDPTDKPSSPQPGPGETATSQPDATPSPQPMEEETDAQPVLLVTREDMEEVQPGQEFTVDFVFSNRGRAAAELPVATFSVSDGLMLMEKATSFGLETIEPEGAYTLRLHLKAQAEITSAQQYVEIKTRYEYLSMNKVERGSAEERVFIPAKVSEKTVQAPVLQIGRTDFAASVKAGEAFSLTLLFHNAGNVAAQNVQAAFSPSEAINLTDAASSRLIPVIEPGKTESVTLNMLANKEIQSPTQSVQVDARYDYVADKGTEQGSASEKIMVPAEVHIPRAGGGGGGGRPKPEPPVPNVIITRYDYGAGQIAAGAEFPLTLTFQNTSEDQTVENILLTMETEEGLSITSASNTVYVPQMAPKAQETRTVKMQVLPNIKSGSVAMTAAFKYEYVTPEKRANNTVTEKLSIPVYQPDRMSISAPTGPESAMAGEETTLSIAYFNKGKGEVYNLSAEVEGEVEALNRVQNIGNIEAGRSGSIDFIIVPQQEGVCKFSIRLTYEDATQTVIQKTFPVSLKVEALMLPEQPEEVPDENMGEEKGQGHNWYVYAAPAALAAAIAGMGLRSRAKKKKLAKQNDAFNFDDLG